MNELKIEPSPDVIIDKYQNYIRIGEYSGGILTKIVGSTNTLIFSEKSDNYGGSSFIYCKRFTYLV